MDQPSAVNEKIKMRTIKYGGIRTFFTLRIFLDFEVLGHFELSNIFQDILFTKRIKIFCMIVSAELF